MVQILLVEDNQKLANSIQNYLQANGYTVTHETRGDKAVYHILRYQPDIVILDVMLPGLMAFRSANPYAVIIAA